MDKLWRSGPANKTQNQNQNQNQNQDQGQSRNGGQPYSRDGSRTAAPRNGVNRPRDEADERTALLPPSQHHHLDPDDPAVSPYNLWSVRWLRYVSIVLLVASFLWWLILLVNCFVTVPALHTRGGVWTAFAYTTLATGTLLALLLFYSVPSKAERIIMGITLLFLFTDMILVVAAYPLRNEESWAGIASIVWALVVTAWAILCDRVVESGKRSEEVRLTGRPETRHSLREWCALFADTILLSIFLAIAILFTINLSIRARDATLAPPGKLYFVDNGRYRVHLNCVGVNKPHHPTLLLEAGERPVEGEDGMAAWAASLNINNTIPRYCYWDRPGFAFSENAPSPFSAGMAVDVLSEALQQANETGPWILVSNGIGGIYSRIFAARHVSEVKGLLLIDTVPEGRLVTRASRGFALWLRGVLSPLGIDRLLYAIFASHHSREDRVFGRHQWQNGGVITAWLQESLVEGGFTRGEIEGAREILPGETPVVVVSSGKKVEKDRGWREGQRGLVAWFERRKGLKGWDVVNGAGHEVWKDEEGKEVLRRRLGELMKLAEN